MSAASAPDTAVNTVDVQLQMDTAEGLLVEGKANEAEILYRTVAEACTAQQGADCRDVWKAKEGLADCLERLNKAGSAAALRAEIMQSSKSRADAGDAAGQCFYGYLLTKGVGLDQDHVAAARYMQLAAEQGNPVALTNLGFMYEAGKGVEKSLDKALELYGQAAAQGHPHAMFAMALAKEDDQEWKLKHLKQAADMGSVAAQFQLGLHHDWSIGIQSDILSSSRAVALGFGDKVALQAVHYFKLVAGKPGRYQKQAEEKLRAYDPPKPKPQAAGAGRASMDDIMSVAMGLYEDSFQRSIQEAYGGGSRRRW